MHCSPRLYRNEHQNKISITKVFILFSAGLTSGLQTKILCVRSEQMFSRTNCQRQQVSRTLQL